jgi:hypothetical protein
MKLIRKFKSSFQNARSALSLCQSRGRAVAVFDFDDESSSSSPALVFDQRVQSYQHEQRLLCTNIQDLQQANKLMRSSNHPFVIPSAGIFDSWAKSQIQDMEERIDYLSKKIQEVNEHTYDTIHYSRPH